MGNGWGLLLQAPFYMLENATNPVKYCLDGNRGVEYNDFCQEGKIMRNRMFVAAGVITVSVSLLAGCTKNEPVMETPEVPSEVVSEIASEIDSIETSETSSLETSEEPVVEEVELPELPILDESGEAYIPSEFTVDEVYSKIDKMVEEVDFESDLDRDKAIATMIYINSPYISKDSFMTIKEDYLGNMRDGDILTLTQSYIRETNVPVNYFFLDDKQADVALQLSDYRKQNKDSDEEYYDLALDYILFSSENIGYNPINYLFYRTDDKHVLIKELKSKMDSDTIASVCAGYKKVDGCIEKTFIDGKSYTFENIGTYFENYQSSHKE